MVGWGALCEGPQWWDEEHWVMYINGGMRSIG